MWKYRLHRNAIRMKGPDGYYRALTPPNNQPCYYAIIQKLNPLTPPPHRPATWLYCCTAITPAQILAYVNHPEERHVDTIPTRRHPR